jgi:hypothetical protein
LLIKYETILVMNDQPVSAPQRGTGLAFVRHWDWVAEKGLMAPASARAIRAAVSQILKIEDNWESVDMRSLDIDGLFARFRNLSKIAPGSLAAYESRFRSGLQSYLAYLDNPTSYQPKTRRAAPRDDKTTPASKRKSSVDVASTSVGSTIPTPITSSSAKLVVYPFPVRPGVFAELKLPADLTVDEALRLSAFLKAVALSEPGGGSQ